MTTEHGGPPINPYLENLKKFLNPETRTLTEPDFEIIGDFVRGAITEHDNAVLGYALNTILGLEPRLDSLAWARLRGMVDVLRHSFIPEISDDEFDFLMPWEEQARKVDAQMQKPPKERAQDWPLPPAYERWDAVPDGLKHLEARGLLGIRNFGGVFEPEITPAGRFAIELFNTRKAKARADEARHNMEFGEEVDYSGDGDPMFDPQNLT